MTPDGFLSNHAGGTLGGISTGLPLTFRVAFKPTSSIDKAQQTVDTSGNRQTFQLPSGSRHDPCVTIRAVPIVEAMAALTLADSLLLFQSLRPIEKSKPSNSMTEPDATLTSSKF